MKLKLVLVFVLTGAPAAFAQPPARPNIVIILADDMGYSDIGCFGSEVPTPNIDSLAKNGVAFTQFYNSARCCPTRAALMTGKWPHQVGIGAMIDDYARGQREKANSPAYMDHLNPDSPTMAEVLRAAGYTTLQSGKWHLGKRPGEWPIKRGFDHAFTQINGAMNYFGGPSDPSQPRDPMALDDQPFTPPLDGFYTTDAFTDRAIEFIDGAAKVPQPKPFFLYLTYNAAHWPLQAPAEDIKKYAGKYDVTWQAVREARFAKQVQLGIVPKEQGMSPMDRGNVKPWEDMKPEMQKQWAKRMEIYAAQIDHMDRQIGRLLAELKTLNIDQNTMVIWLSDNGGAAEDPHRKEKGSDNPELGTRDSFWGYARPWATVSNTPFKFHKVTCYEGGISTPMLVRWPAGIPTAQEGKLIREPGHVTDLLPTVIEAARATYPADKPKLEGESLLSTIKSGKGNADRTFYWEHEGNRGVRRGDWKLDSLGSSDKWELYNLATDRIESKNQADTNTDKLKTLSGLYEAWAKRVGVFDPKHGEANAAPAKEGEEGR